MSELWERYQKIIRDGGLVSRQKGGQKPFSPQPQTLSNDTRAFLEKHVPSPALEVFPDWQGIVRPQKKKIDKKNPNITQLMFLDNF